MSHHCGVPASFSSSAVCLTEWMLTTNHQGHLPSALGQPLTTAALSLVELLSFSGATPSHTGNWTLFPWLAPFLRMNILSSFSPFSENTVQFLQSCRGGRVSSSGMMVSSPQSVFQLSGKRPMECSRGVAPLARLVECARRGEILCPGFPWPPYPVSKPSAGHPRRAPRLQSLYE